MRGHPLLGSITASIFGMLFQPDPFSVNVIYEIFDLESRNRLQCENLACSGSSCPSPPLNLRSISQLVYSNRWCRCNDFLSGLAGLDSPIDSSNIGDKVWSQYAKSRRYVSLYVFSPQDCFGGTGTYPSHSTFCPVGAFPGFPFVDSPSRRVQTCYLASSTHP